MRRAPALDGGRVDGSGGVKNRMLDAWIAEIDDDLMIALNADTYEEGQAAVLRAATALHNMQAIMHRLNSAGDEVVGVAT